MRPILLALALLSLPASLAVAQGVDMGQGHCAKHGNYTGSSCHKCAGGSGEGSGGSNSGISAAELAEMRRQAAEAAERERVEREKRRAEHEKEEIDAALETARQKAPQALEEQKKSEEAERIRQQSAEFGRVVLGDLFEVLRSGDTSKKSGGLDFAGAGTSDPFSKGEKDSAPVDGSGKPPPKLGGSAGEALDFLPLPDKDSPVARIAEEDITKKAEELLGSTEARKKYVQDPKTKQTHCNELASDFAEQAWHYRGLKGKLANEIVDFVRSEVDGWTPLHDPKKSTDLKGGLERAQQLANDGYLVLVGWQGPTEGHVAVVVPGDMADSTGWGGEKSVPMIAQAGPEGRTFPKDRLSQGFGSETTKAEIVVYYREK